MGKSIAKLLIVLLLIAAVVFAAFGSYTIFGVTQKGAFEGDISIKQGLDLVGGSVLTFEAITDKATPEQMATVVSVMRRRLDDKQYTEAVVTTQGEKRVRVEIPSVSDPNEAENLLGKTAKLTFVNADGEVVIDGTDIKSAKKAYDVVDDSGVPQNHVVLTLNKESISKFADATRMAAQRSAEGNNYIAIMLDETEISRPFVDAKYSVEGINDESVVISGNFTPEDAVDLANLISAGQLPFDLEVKESSAVGATLGSKALDSSLWAGLIGIILIILFMLIMYRIPGLAADLALVFYVGLFVFVMQIMGLNLTLAGIAGVILTIGMAVDANVIIFERVKEEIRSGKTVKAAVGAGFKRAFVAIVDSNITTLIAAVVLYVIGVGSVKGFAITLGLGVIISMFTAIFITKFILAQFANIFGRNPKLYGGR